MMTAKRALQLLDNPLVWEVSRIGLDLTFGLYRKRLALLREWGVAGRGASVLDIGCGIGQYSSITSGRYVGVDLNDRYVTYARLRRGGENRQFISRDVCELAANGERFDAVLMVDFLHHLPDRACQDVLKAAARLSRGPVVSFEPVTAQTNPVGRWIVDHDRGDYVRNQDRLHGLFDQDGLEILESRALRLGPIQTRAILARTGLLEGAAS
jgi:2-polyprenyl-3-methyl-5-hydroxy-6-metoxy-1,4-benzoquinol methylase